MAVEASDQSEGTRVVLSGTVGLQEIQQLKSLLEPAMRNQAGILLELGGLRDIDVSVLQLMHALLCAGRAAETSPVRVSGLSAELARLVADIGGAGKGCGRVCGHPRCIFEEQ